MRASIIAGAVLLMAAGAAGIGAVSSAHEGSPTRQWAFTELARGTMVGGQWLEPGEYLVEHDYDREARGESCMRLFAVGVTSEGPEDRPAASFRCILRERPKVDELTLTIDTTAGDLHGCTDGWSWLLDTLTGVQFAGDAVAHLVPEVGTR